MLRIVAGMLLALSVSITAYADATGAKVFYAEGKLRQLLHGSDKKKVEDATKELQDALKAAGSDFAKNSPGFERIANATLAEAQSTLKMSECLRQEIVEPEPKPELPRYSNKKPSLAERAFKCAQATSNVVNWSKTSQKSYFFKDQTNYKPAHIWMLKGKKAGEDGMYYVTRIGLAFFKDKDSSKCREESQYEKGGVIAVSLDGLTKIGYSDHEPGKIGFPLTSGRSELGLTCNLTSKDEVLPEAAQALSLALVDTISALNASYDQSVKIAERTCGRWHVPNRDAFLEAIHFCRDVGLPEVDKAIDAEVRKFQTVQTAPANGGTPTPPPATN